MLDFATWIERDSRKDVAILLAARAAARAVPCLAGMKPKLPLSDSQVSGIIDSMQSILLGLGVEHLFSYENRSEVRGIVYAKQKSSISWGTENTISGRFARSSASFLVMALSSALGEGLTPWHMAAVTASHASQAFTGDGAVQASMAVDITELESGLSPSELVLRPLWRDIEATCASSNWRIIKQALVAEDEQYESWISWYESVWIGRDWNFNARVNADRRFYCNPKDLKM